MFKKFLNKLTSVKVLALIFCCSLVTYIVVKGKTEFIEIAKILSYAPLSYFVANVAEDFVFNNPKLKKPKDKYKVEDTSEER